VASHSNDPGAGEREAVDDLWATGDVSPAMTPVAGSGAIEDAPVSSSPPSIVWKDPAVDTARRRIPARNEGTRDDTSPPAPVEPRPANSFEPIHTPIPRTLPPPPNYTEIRRTARRPAFTPAHPLTPPQLPPHAIDDATGSDVLVQTSLSPASIPPIGRGITALVVGLVSIGVLCTSAAAVIVARNERAVPVAPAESAEPATAPAPPPAPTAAAPATADPPAEDDPASDPASEPVPAPSALASARARSGPSNALPAATREDAPPPPVVKAASPPARPPDPTSPATSSSAPPGLQFLKRNL
jgi:hypothetical protein